MEYALSQKIRKSGAAGVSFAAYIFAGLVPNWMIVLPVSVIVMIGVLLVIRKTMK